MEALAQPRELLVDRLQEGDERAFEVLYQQHHGELLRFCRRRLGSPSEAEDAVQQVFFSAYGALRGNAPPRPLRPWLYAIARNRCISMLRARRAQPLDLPELATPGPEAELELREAVRELTLDLAELSEPQRAALILSEVGGLSHAEIGPLIGCETGRVKSLVFRARAALKHQRDARELSCELVREQLSTLRRGALRRNSLRLHLKVCPSCAEFRAQLRRRNRGMAVFLPVWPLPALRRVLTAFGSNGGLVGAGTVGGPATLLASPAVGLGLVVVAAAVWGGAAGIGTDPRAATGQHVHPRSTDVPATLRLTPISAVPALARSRAERSGLRGLPYAGADGGPASPAGAGRDLSRPEQLGVGMPGTGELEPSALAAPRSSSPGRKGPGNGLAQPRGERRGTHGSGVTRGGERGTRREPRRPERPRRPGAATPPAPGQAGLEPRWPDARRPATPLDPVGPPGQPPAAQAPHAGPASRPDTPAARAAR